MGCLDNSCKSGLSQVDHGTWPPGIVLRTGQNAPVRYQRKALTKCVFFCSKVMAFLPISPKGRFKIPTLGALLLLSLRPPTLPGAQRPMQNGVSSRDGFRNFSRKNRCTLLPRMKWCAPPPPHYHMSPSGEEGRPER